MEDCPGFPPKIRHRRRHHRRCRHRRFSLILCQFLLCPKLLMMKSSGFGFTAFTHQANIGPSAIAQGGLFGPFFPEILIFSEMCDP